MRIHSHRYRCARLIVQAAVAAALVTSGAYADDLVSYTVTAEHGRFDPETLNVPANTRFRIVITNKGPGPEEFESADLNLETVLASCVTRSLVVPALKPGSYTFFGEFHPATANGRIVVK